MKIFSLADLGKEKKFDWRREESNPEHERRLQQMGQCLVRKGHSELH